MDALDESESPAVRRARKRVGLFLRGKWRLDSLLGVGGMAAVYAGTHRNGKRGAVKMLHVELSAEEGVRKRFLREGYVANAVGHSGAVSVLDDDVAEDGSVFLVMELLEGHTLESRSEAAPGGRLPVAEVLAIADQLLDVLAAAHGKGIVHRDIKPENVFLTQRGELKVLDFGLARLRDMPMVSRMTLEGTAMGTPAFMPPEQALGDWDSVGAQSDLWAVGATLFTLLTGRLVHVADTVNKLLLAAMTKPAPPLRTLMPEMPAEVALVVDRALAFDAKNRWPDAAAMREAVHRAIAVVGRAQLSVSSAASLPPAAMAASGPRNPGDTELMATITPTWSEPAVTMPARSKVALFVAIGAAAMVLGALSLAVHSVLGRPSLASPTPSAVAAEASSLPPVAQTSPSIIASASAPPPFPAASAGALQASPPSTPSKRPSTGPRPGASSDPFGRW